MSPTAKTWKTVYIRVVDYDKILPSGNPQYKWLPVGKMRGYGTVAQNWSVEWIK